MNILEIIAKKRDKQQLSEQEINYFVTGYTKGEITDYQAAALVMAIYINGMTAEETKNLTLSMAHSGEVLDLSSLGKIIVDKHSTGGVGDKVSLVLLPIIASLGVPVAKMSGRGLGFTGGTIDKLESIPGYEVNVNTTDFIDNVQKIGISMIGQTLNLAPADKKLYALRDTISCVDSIPLIASSVMSKKIAAGANKIVLEVTVGAGAFMATKEEAIELSKAMKQIGELANKETVCVLTNMDEPLGKAVGNILEIKETIECLKGNITEDVKETILTIGAYMLKLAGEGETISENEQRILENIENGKAYIKFKELVQNQGGDLSYIEDVSKFPKAQYIFSVIAKQSGYIKELNARKIGEIANGLGAGRIRKEDEIDPSVGIVLEKKIGDFTKEGEVLAYIHVNDEKLGLQACDMVQDTYICAHEKVNRPQIKMGVI